MAKKPIKKTTKKTTAKAKVAPKAPAKRRPHLYREPHPEQHDITGKYVFLYMFFAICTLIFALTTIYLYSTTHEVIRRYTHFIERTQDNGTKCEGEDNE